MLNLQMTVYILSKAYALQPPLPASIVHIIVGSHELYVDGSFYAYFMLLPPDPGFLIADWHHPVISRCSVPIHL